MKALRKTLIMILAVTGLAWGTAAPAGTIQQTIQFPGVAPEALYMAFMSSKGHAAMTGFPATFYRPSTKQDVAEGQEGDVLHAFGVNGKDGKFLYLIDAHVLRLVPGKEIVLTWHAAMWDAHAKPGEATRPDCILVLTLQSAYGGTELQLVQANVPDFPGDSAQEAAAEVTSETAEVNTNWYFRYWAPMQKYFQAQMSAPKGASQP